VLDALGSRTSTGAQTIGKVDTDSKWQSATTNGCFLHADQTINDDDKT